MVPWYYKADPSRKDPHEAWKSILVDRDRYPIARFMNEVLAISYDSGHKPLSRAEVRRVCDPSYLMDEDHVVRLSASHHLYGGIDWGTGSEGSYSVLFVGGYTRGDSNFQIVYAKRFVGDQVDPEPQLREISRLIRKFKLKVVVADYGMGFHQNKVLTSAFGPVRIQQFQYVARSPNKVKYMPQLSRHLVFRTPVMADVINAVKSAKIRFPAWSVFEEPYANDMLALRASYSETLRMLVYNKPRGITDDSFHALVYCLCASFFYVRRPDIMSPIQETADGGAQSIVEDQAMREMEDLLAEDYAVPPG
jgi:hypothetical protein